MDHATGAETWQELVDNGASALLPLKPHLFVVLEADRPTAGSARYSLADIDEIVIGRGSERRALREMAGTRRRLVVRVPGRFMSSDHARLWLENGAWVLEDSESKNGTFFRGERVSRAEVADGDVFDAGHTLFALRLALPTPRPCASDVDSAMLEPRSPGLSTLLPAASARVEAFERVAHADIPMLLLGETGTGKELLARAVHELSGRRGAFVAVNCGALTPTLVEALLFGHVKGAYSGATRDEPGLIRSADGGTLFLDEIGDLPAATQAALLRVLQEHEVLPVGSTRPIAVDCRVVCATHRSLDALVDAGHFRSDLLARIDGFRHTLPPLRDRREDLGLLMASLLPRVAGERTMAIQLSTSAARSLYAHPWPGNVRELLLCLARAVALTASDRLEAADFALPSPSFERASMEVPALEGDQAHLRLRLMQELESHRGNVSRVARSMGKARMQIQRWMRRFGLQAEAFRTAR
jgi:transcriptional regulator of acetoin/glycerol metabolism